MRTFDQAARAFNDHVPPRAVLRLTLSLVAATFAVEGLARFGWAVRIVAGWTHSA